MYNRLPDGRIKDKPKSLIRKIENDKFIETTEYEEILDFQQLQVKINQLVGQKNSYIQGIEFQKSELQTIIDEITELEQLQSQIQESLIKKINNKE
jgi:hypothetical protein